MRRVILAVAIAGSIVGSTLLAQDADRKVSIGITIVDSVSGRPIERASVVVTSAPPFDRAMLKQPAAPQQRSTVNRFTTDSTGGLHVSTPPKWNVNIQASKQGYENGSHGLISESDT